MHADVIFACRVPGIPGEGVCSGCWWIRAHHMNWNVVSNGGMTIAALALADVPRYASVAKEALKFAREGIPLALSGYGPSGDGAWPEGPGYWVYTTKWLLAETECLYTATGHDNGYMETAGVRDTGLYALQMYQTPSGVDFNYGDAAEASTDMEVSSNLLGLAARFPELAEAVGTAARHALARSPQHIGDNGWDVIALSLMRWDGNGGQNSKEGQAADRVKNTSSVADDLHNLHNLHNLHHADPKMPLAGFYSAQGVGVVRSGWSSQSSFLGTARHHKE